jgi:hypothetical protein
MLMSEVRADVFRKAYRPLSDDQKFHMEKIKDLAEQLHIAFELAEAVSPVGRHMSLAKTNLEQSVMWAIKSIT